MSYYAGAVVALSLFALCVALVVLAIIGTFRR